MNISAPFIERPVATTLLAVAILLTGSAAYFQLPVSALPKVDFPTLLVSAALPGASPETMAASMAAPLERRFGRISGLTDMTSSSTLGSTSIVLQFALDRNVDAAARDVQAAISAASADLPSDLPARPLQRKIDPSDSPILVLGLTSSTVPIGTLFSIADSVLAPRLASVRGVGQVFLAGGAQPAIRVQADPGALHARGLGLPEVAETIAEATVLRPSGSISDRQRRNLAPTSQLFGEDAFRSIVLRSANGSITRLSDVASVHSGVVNDRAAAWIDGQRAVILMIRREPGANVIETIERIERVLPTLDRLIPSGASLATVVDRSGTIRAAVADVQVSLALSVALVVLVVFAFLRSVRATVIPSVAVPLSLAGTFAAMYVGDFSLNVLSLMALTVSTGFVVDDAIVMTENVVRAIERGEPPKRAALLGSKQIGFTILSITVALLSVFLPILFIGGMVGRLFREMALTLSAAITISAIVSLTITPAMCATILRPAEQAPGRISRAVEWFFSSMQEAYGRGLDRVLAHRISTLIALGAAIALSALLISVTPKGLFPQQDTGVLFGFTTAPEDVSFSTLVARQQRVGSLVAQDPAIAHTVAFVGGGPGGSATNTASMMIALRPVEEGRASAQKVARRIGERFETDPEVQVFMTPAQDVRIGGRSSRSQYQYTLQSEDVDLLRIWSSRLEAALRQEPDLTQVSSDQSLGGLDLQIAIDRDTASRLGVTPRDIDLALSSAFGQRQVATTFTDTHQIRVILEVRPDARDDPSDLDGVLVRSASGAMIPLRSLSTVTRERTPLAVNHQGQIPSVTVTFNLAPGLSLERGLQIVRAVESRIGMPANVRGGWSSTAQTFEESSARQPFLILAALLVVYLVLGMLYESLIHPLTILSTLPPAAVGALVALYAFHMELDTVALIGIILLVGIVAKNAIMMIDFAIEKQQDGLDAVSAVREAATLRFRPIVMTTLAAIGGALPLALGSGIGSELRSPLGVTIVGGLAASQLLTLFTAPVVYVVLDRFSRRRRTVEE